MIREAPKALYKIIVPNKRAVAGKLPADFSSEIHLIYLIPIERSSFERLVQIGFRATQLHVESRSSTTRRLIYCAK